MLCLDMVNLALLADIWMPSSFTTLSTHCLIRGYADPPTPGQKSLKRGVVTYVRHFEWQKSLGYVG